jgi:hypothetical protein
MKQMEIEVRQFVDDQIGLDSASYSIHGDGSVIRIAAKKVVRVESEKYRLKLGLGLKSDYSQDESMKEEWKDTATALIAFLKQNEFGKYELISVSRNHCEVIRMEDDK